MKNFKSLGLFSSKGRIYAEPYNKFRTPFQRDRDRIIHSASFRRLKHKTQVFVNTEGDHYRTRITHSIEVAQIARTMAKYLNVNEELAETLSLAHDLGHTPFGHAGEDALNECMDLHGGFDHNLQTLRIVMFLENKYINFNGLNLTIETLDGLLKHNGPIEDIDHLNNLIGLKYLKNKIHYDKYPSLESQIAAISDDIAYNNHDIQDGLNAKLLDFNELLEINFFKNIYKKYKKKIRPENKQKLVYQIIRDSINLMVQDIINTTINNIKKNKIKSINNIYNADKSLVNFSNNFIDTIDEIRSFLRINMYNNEIVLKKNENGKKIIKNLFEKISKKPKKYLNKDQLKFDKYRAISDYISGMTDRYAINLHKILKIVKDLNKKTSVQLPQKLNSINVDIPPEKFDADISSNVAMVVGKLNKTNPMEFGKIIEKELSKDENIEKIELIKPGFVNIKLKQVFWNKFLEDIIKNNHKFGINNKENKIKYLVEFVSANPTGPLHVGHCRGAILGDVISNLLKFNNHTVSKEYYVNDYGNQVINFTKSVYFRIREIINKDKFPIDNPDLYPGDYIIEIANNIINQNKDKKFDNFENVSSDLKDASIKESIKLIKKNLESLGILHDHFQSETDLVNKNEVEKVIEKLKEKNLVYTGKIKAPETNEEKNWVERDQLLFKSTDFGDDKDRALQKSDNTWTYFASDVAYHYNKLNRKYDKLVNILGADHAGYIKRISSSVEALSGDKNKLVCKVSQLVKLIKDGKPFKMSKRKGSYITVDDLINEVGKDATRFIMLNRSSDVELDFDFTKVKEKSKDNPLYYVQYCYARISSVFRHINKNIEENIEVKNYNFNYTDDEIKILKKISQWPKCIEIASNKLEPHRIPTYLYELSSEFHSYWNMGKDDKNKRFIDDNKNISDDKIIFLKAISNVIKTGMNIVGVSTPEKM